jgi:hypothetical protein
VLTTVGRISGLPGVEHAAAAFQTPFTPGGDNSIFSIRGREHNANDPAPHADYAFVSSDYFKSLGLPILKGRGFQPSDMRAGNYFAPNSVAIVDAELAKRFWPDGDALGGGVSWSPTGPWASVVGICATAQLKDLAEESKGTFYLPSYFGASTIVVRTSGDPRTLISARRDQVLAVDLINCPRYKDNGRASGNHAETRRFAVVLLASLHLPMPGLACMACLRSPCLNARERLHSHGLELACDVLVMVIKQGSCWSRLVASLVGHAYAHVMESLLLE